MMKGLSIGGLARRSGLSRSTLLYYDRIGLLHPGGRSPTGYRFYRSDEVRRLDQIKLYRSMGVPLREIIRLLDNRDRGVAAILRQRAEILVGEIISLHDQLRVLLRVQQSETGELSRQLLDKTAWVKLLQATGLDEAGMDRWHAEFERLFPEAHQTFLSSLGIPEEEVKGIRQRARGA